MVKLESLLKIKDLLFHYKEIGNAQTEKNQKTEEKILGVKILTATAGV